jgi:flagellar hook-associated protein 1 FlgK
MGGLFSALNSSLEAIRAFQTALDISQNNVSNASTPGYARQVATLEAQPFEPSAGSTGGVLAGAPASTQNEYANQAVRNQLAMQGNSGAQSSALASIQGLFDVSGQSGLIGALNSLFQSFSGWAVTPASTATQQDVLAKAQALAQSFQSTAASLSGTTNQLNQQISSTVRQIDQIASQIQADNTAILQSRAPDPGLDANLHAALESLSQLVDTTVTLSPDGTATVLLGGQTPLVIGTQQYSLGSGFAPTAGSKNPGAVPDVQILDAHGRDVTGQILQGSLAGLLTARNVVLPSLQGNGEQQGTLNQLAQQVADRVNQILTSATTLNGQPGGPLFGYNTSNATDIARTLAVDSKITPGTLAPTQPGAPPVSNGAALALSNLGNSTNPADQIDGHTILQFLSATAAQVGQQTSDAHSGEDVHTQLLAQARALQIQISGVSLDAEAIEVMELQKGYQAAGKMVSVIDTLTQTLLNMGPA